MAVGRTYSPVSVLGREIHRVGSEAGRRNVAPTSSVEFPSFEGRVPLVRLGRRGTVRLGQTLCTNDTGVSGGLVCTCGGVLCKRERFL